MKTFLEILKNYFNDKQKPPGRHWKTLLACLEMKNVWRVLYIQWLQQLYITQILSFSIRPWSPQHRGTMSGIKLLKPLLCNSGPLWPGCSELVNTEILIVALGIIVSILLLVTTHSVFVSSRGNELYGVYKFICK